MTVEELFAKYQQVLTDNPQFDAGFDPYRWINIHAMLKVFNEVEETLARAEASRRKAHENAHNLSDILHKYHSTDADEKAEAEKSIEKSKDYESELRTRIAKLEEALSDLWNGMVADHPSDTAKAIVKARRALHPDTEGDK